MACASKLYQESLKLRHTNSYGIPNNYPECVVVKDYQPDDVGFFVSVKIGMEPLRRLTNYWQWVLRNKGLLHSLIVCAGKGSERKCNTITRVLELKVSGSQNKTDADSLLSLEYSSLVK